MSGVRILECDENWRGLFGVELSVKETRGEVPLDQFEADLSFIDGTC